MNPQGTITLPTAWGRFRLAKWAGADPLDELAYLWNMALARRERWNMLPGAPLWDMALYSPPQAVARIVGLSPEPAVALLSELKKRGLENRIEHILSSEPRAEAEEFMGAFKSGELTAIGHNLDHAEPEAWEFLEVAPTVGRDFNVKNVPWDWHRLFVAEDTLSKWAAGHEPGGPHHALTRSRQVIRATLQTMVLLEAVSMERAEELAREWGYRRLADTEATLTEDAMLVPTLGPKSKEAEQQEVKCRQWLKARMEASKSQKTATKEVMWVEAKQLFPLVQERTFTHVIWPALSGDYPAWRKRGRLTNVSD